MQWDVHSNDDGIIPRIEDTLSAYEYRAPIDVRNLSSAIDQSLYVQSACPGVFGNQENKKKWSRTYTSWNLPKNNKPTPTLGHCIKGSQIMWCSQAKEI